MRVRLKRIVTAVTCFGLVVITLVLFYGNDDNAATDTNDLHNKVNQNPVNEIASNVNITADNKNCDAECAKFRELLSRWPPEKPKSVIYVLTQPHRMRSLERLLHSVDTYFNHAYHYPIVVFHESNFRYYRDRVRNATESVVYFQEVAFSVPKYVQRPVPEEIPCPSTIGYRHMCRFQAMTVYEEAILVGVDYYWRFDDNSLLISPVTYDIFTFMRRNHYTYGYIWRHSDATQCTVGLWEGTTRYIKTHGIHTEFFSEWPAPWLYYNNFEVSALSVWRSEAYRRYIAYIDHLGGIYHHRWGDAPIKGIAVAMFLPRNQTHRFADLGYQHETYVHRPDGTSNNL